MSSLCPKGSHRIHGDHTARGREAREKDDAEQDGGDGGKVGGPLDRAMELRFQSTA